MVNIIYSLFKIREFVQKLIKPSNNKAENNIDSNGLNKDFNSNYQEKYKESEEKINMHKKSIADFIVRHSPK